MSFRLVVLSWLLLSTLACQFHNHDSHQDHHNHVHEDGHHQEEHPDISVHTHRGLSEANNVTCHTQQLTKEEMKEEFKMYSQWAMKQSIHGDGKSRRLATIRIPTVFHIMASPVTGEGAIAANFVNAQINRLNSAFAIAGIEFFLARQPVITRNQRWFEMRDLGAINSMKAALKQGGPETLNIYSGFFPGGFATFPRFYVGNELIDGCVVGYPFITDLSDPVVPHEVGHWLELFHTFGMTDTGVNGARAVGCDCIGDLIEDTPAQLTPTRGCPVGRDTCPNSEGLDPIFNFMDYSSCGREFTPMQAERMIWAWETFRSPDAKNGNVESPLPTFASSPPAFPCQPGNPGRNLVVQLTTDFCGFESIWDVRDSDDEIVLSSALYDSYQTYTDGPYCLSPGDYKFTMYDRFGDGLVNVVDGLLIVGGYRVLLDGEVLVSGGDFQCAESTQFRVSSSTPSPTTAPPIRPPTNPPRSFPSEISCASFPTDTEYHITARHSNLALSVAFASINDGANIVQWYLSSRGTVDNWRLVPTSNNFYSIVSDFSGKALRVNRGFNGQGTNIMQWTFSDGGTNDEWCFFNRGDGYYGILNRQSTGAIEVAEGSLRPFANVREGIDSGADFQSWNVVTSNPTQSPVPIPTQAPTNSPTLVPTSRPTQASLPTLTPPTNVPTRAPQAQPTTGCASFSNNTSYHIIARHSNLALNVASGSLNNGGNIVQWPVSSQLTNDNWKLVPTSDGYYSIVSELSGKALNVFRSLTAPGTNIIQWTISESNINDDWCFVDRSNGSYGIKNRLTGGVVEVADGSLAAGANVQQGNDSGADFQSWRFIGIEGTGNPDPRLVSPPTVPTVAPACASFSNSTSYHIIARHSNLALNVASGSLNNGGNIVQWPVSSQLTNDNWKLVPTSDGYYSIVSELSGKALNVFRSLTAPGTNIIQWTISESNINDDWCFVDRSNGSYGIKNRLTGGVVEVADGSLAAGANVQQGNDSGADFQSWRVVAV